MPKVSYKRKNNFEKSKEYFRAATGLRVSEDKKDFFYFWKLGESYSHLMMLDEAIDSFLEALELQPERDDMNLYIASCYSLQNDKARALEHLRRTSSYFVEEIEKDSAFDNMKYSKEFQDVLIRLKKESNMRKQ